MEISYFFKSYSNKNIWQTFLWQGVNVFNRVATLQNAASQLRSVVRFIREFRPTTMKFRLY